MFLSFEIFEFWSFDIVSNFDIRISSLLFTMCYNRSSKC